MELWTAHQHVFGKAMPIMALDGNDKTPRDVERNLHCAENLLCTVNAHSRKETSMIRYDLFGIDYILGELVYLEGIRNLINIYIFI